MQNICQLATRFKTCPASIRHSVSPDESSKTNLIAFKSRQVDMMPGNWAMPGNPTPYELCTTIQTCKRLWKLNKEALNYVDCDQDVTLYNLNVLEKLFINLMDYLVD